MERRERQTSRREKWRERRVNEDGDVFTSLPHRFSPSSIVAFHSALHERNAPDEREECAYREIEIDREMRRPEDDGRILSLCECVLMMLIPCGISCLKGDWIVC